MPSDQSPVRLLVLDHDTRLAELVVKTLREEFRVPPEQALVVTTPEAAFATLRSVPAESPLVVITDDDLHAKHTGLDVLLVAQHLHPGSIRIIMTRQRAKRFEAYRDAVHAFVPKPIALAELGPLVRRLRVARERRE